MAFVDVFGPLYALYTLWFVDHGISTRQISAVFALWGGSALLLEMPSGALADRVDSRHLLAVASIFRGVGISVWMVWPTFPGVLLGAMLWAIHTAAFSGAWEAMLYDELEQAGFEDRYAVVMARVGQFSSLGVAAGAITASALIAVGVTIEVLGWMTVAIHGVGIGLVLRLPTVHRSEDAGPELANDPVAAAGPSMMWWGTLRSGLRDARGSAVVLRLVLVGAVVEGLAELDEYVPILGRNRGASNVEVLMLVLAIWTGSIAGGEVAARRPKLSGRTLGALLVVTAIGFGAGLVTAGLWWLLLIAVGYGAMEVTWVLGDARLQERTSSATRATVGSVRGLIAGVVNMGFFATVAWLSDGDNPTPGLALAVVMLAVVGVLASFLLPSALPDERQPLLPTR